MLLNQLLSSIPTVKREQDLIKPGISLVLVQEIHHLVQGEVVPLPPLDVTKHLFDVSPGNDRI